jgi:hypothetical protein
LKNEKYTLGLDISTSIIGISIFKDYEFLELDHINLTKIKCIFDKAEVVYNKFLELKEKYTISEIYIEDILQSFQRGLSSAKTLTQLAKFNGIVSNIANQQLGVKPVFLNVNTARKILGIKINKNSDKSTKEQIIEWVDKDLNGYEWPTKIISRGKNKGCVKFENYCYDISDAYVICKAGIKNNEFSG